MAKLINSWEELVGLESENYYLDIDLDMLNGWIKPKDHYKDKDSHGWYLTTHSFYESTCKGATSLLQKCGFDIELKGY